MKAFYFMRLEIIFLIGAISIFFVITQAGQVFSQASDTCNSHMVCVHSGDILNYSTTFGPSSSFMIYNFGDMIDSTHIRIIEQNQANNNKIQNYTRILDLKTGFTHSEQDTNKISPFLEIIPTPMDYNKTDSSITQIVTDFNGFKRTALVAFHSSENSTSKMIFDAETGILLEAKSTSILTISNVPELVVFTDKLISTNTINSDSSEIQTLKKSISIPSWVKNNAGWWANGSMNDSDFIKGIQYLIKHGIIQVPHDISVKSSSESIPAWVKHSAGWWADGTISNEEFVKGIQWLISSGIIQA